MAYAQTRTNRAFGKTNPALTLTYENSDSQFHALVYRVKTKWASHFCAPASAARFMREYQKSPHLVQPDYSEDPTDPTDPNDELPF